MRRIRSAAMLAITSLALVAWAAPPCWACSCVPASDEEHYARADVVFVGKVVAREEPSAHDPYQSSSDPITWTFEVEQTQKGEARRTESVRSARDDATCGYRFEVGGRYQVFANRSENGELWTSICSGTRNVDREPAYPAPGSSPAPDAPTPAPPTPALPASPSPTPEPTPTPDESPSPSAVAAPPPEPGDTSGTARAVVVGLAVLGLGSAALIGLRRLGTG